MSDTITVVCVKWGRQYPAGFVNILYDMVRRHLPNGYPFSFCCFTDDPAGLDAQIAVKPLPPGLKGWWNKLYLFREGLFAAGERMVFFDLDTLIVGDLEPVFNYRGAFALLSDFYRPREYNSSVMLWRAGACDTIWHRYEAQGYPEVTGGDQAWIEKVYSGADRLQSLFPEFFASYKVDCRPLPPQSARVICFHGEPKQDNCNAPWVGPIWKIGGAEALPADLHYSSRQEEEACHARHALTLPHPWLEPVAAHTGHAVIIGGGPSLGLCVDTLRELRTQNHTFFALNNSAVWLQEQAIRFDAHVMTGANEVAISAQNEDIMRYYASTCHPSVFENVRTNLVLWHPPMPGVQPTVEGSTLGINALRIAYLLGYRRMHLFGYDGSYSPDGRHHAYAQPQNDTDRLFDVSFNDRHFDVSIWMHKQVQEFFTLADALVKEHCLLSLYGDGLIPFMASHAANTPC